MEGPRAPREGELQSLISFLNKNLRPETGWSIGDEYPTAINPENLKNIRIIKESDQVLSHALVRPIMMKTPAGFFKIAAIGSVVTSSEHRNKGLSKKIIEDCLALAKEQGNDFAILWSDLYDFYRKMNFELAGSEVSALIDKKLDVKTDTEFKLMHSNKVDAGAIYKLFSRHTVCTMRTIDEIAKYLKIPNSNVYTAWNPDGTIAAYAVEGKGADLQGYVHEWGGGVEALTALLNYIYIQRGEAFTIIMPGHSVNLIHTLERQGFRTHQGYLGMMQVLNPKFLFPKIVRHAQVDLGISDFVFQVDKDGYYFGAGDNVVKIKREKDLTRLLLGPIDVTSIQGLTIETQEKLKKVFPIRMWLWGWDSV